MERKELLQRHPLFRRLTGQVIWTLFEEYDSSQEDIDAFLDYFFAVRDDCLEIMARLNADPQGAVRVILEDQGRPCEHCRRLEGKLLPGRGADIFPLLPPYGLGCRARPEYLSHSEIEALGTPAILSQEDIPANLLHCPSEWLFSHPWRKGNFG